MHNMQQYRKIEGHSYSIKARVKSPISFQKQLYLNFSICSDLYVYVVKHLQGAPIDEKSTNLPKIPSPSNSKLTQSNKRGKCEDAQNIKLT